MYNPLKRNLGYNLFDTHCLDEHLLNIFFHVLITEVCSCCPAVPIVHCEVQDILCQLSVVESVLIFLSLPYVAGAAHVAQAHLWDGLPVLYAGWEENGLIDAIVPDAEGVPCGRPPATVGVEAGGAALAGGDGAGGCGTLLVLQEAGRERGSPYLEPSISYQIN